MRSWRLHPEQELGEAVVGSSLTPRSNVPYELPRGFSPSIGRPLVDSTRPKPLSPLRGEGVVWEATYLGLLVTDRSSSSRTIARSLRYGAQIAMRTAVVLLLSGAVTRSVNWHWFPERSAVQLASLGDSS